MRATKVALFIWVEFREENETGRWVGIRAEIKNEIAALANFGNENEMRPFHKWNSVYPNLATPHSWAFRRNAKNVYGFLHTRSFSSAFFNVRLCCAGRALRARSRP